MQQLHKPGESLGLHSPIDIRFLGEDGPDLLNPGHPGHVLACAGGGPQQGAERLPSVALRAGDLLCGLLCQAGHDLGHDGGQAKALYSTHGSLPHPGPCVPPPVHRVVLQGYHEAVKDMRHQLLVKPRQSSAHNTAQSLHSIPPHLCPLLCPFCYLAALDEGMDDHLLIPPQDAAWQDPQGRAETPPNHLPLPQPANEGGDQLVPPLRVQHPVLHPVLVQEGRDGCHRGQLHRQLHAGQVVLQDPLPYKEDRPAMQGQARERQVGSVGGRYEEAGDQGLLMSWYTSLLMGLRQEFLATTTSVAWK